MMKRFLTIATLATLLLTSFAACAKKEENTATSTPTPTTAVSQDATENNSSSDDSSQNTAQTIVFGGYFSREDATLTIGIADNAWKVSGYLFSKEEGVAPLILSGPLSFTENTDFIYEDENNKLTFTFAVDSVTVTVNSGTTYSAFAGSYKRLAQEDTSDQVLSPENGSSLELLGRIALTHYMLLADGAVECSIDTTALSFDSEYMAEFLLAYADLFLTSEAEPLPELSDKYLCYTFTKTDLNDLFLAVTAGTFDVAKFDVTGTDIISKDGNYYVPCLGAISGGLTTSSENQELVSENLSLGGVVSKADGTRYDIEMTLSTKANTASGSVGTQITSVDCKLIK